MDKAGNLLLVKHSYYERSISSCLPVSAITNKEHNSSIHVTTLVFCFGL